MNDISQYNLKLEVENATLDPKNASRLITPAGFSLQSSEGDREIVELVSPAGRKYLLENWPEYNDEENIKAGGIWHYSMPKNTDVLKISSSENGYSVNQFIQDIVERFVKLGNEKRPDWKSFVVTWDKD